MTEIQWAMARVRECLGVLGCNLESPSFSPFAARRVSGLANRTAFFGRNSRRHKLGGTNYVPPREALVGESDFQSPWPDSHALFARQTDVEARGTLLYMRCQYGTASPTVKLPGRSQRIHDGYLREKPPRPHIAQTLRGAILRLASVRSLTYSRYISACLV